MIFNWQKKLIHDIEPMDSEHVQIIEQMDKLYEAIQQRASNEVILETMTFLSKYVDEHFKSEEKLQRETNYPNYEEHIKLHAEFKDRVKKMTQKIETDGLNTSLKIEISKMIIEWFKNHIAEDDKLIAEHSKKEKLN